MKKKKLQVGFVGLGKLGKIAAETVHKYHHCFGYDLYFDDPETSQERQDAVRCHTSSNLEGACEDRDIVLIAVQTPHHPDYDGREPTSHLPPKDFNYEHIIKVVKDVDDRVNEGTIIAVISTMLPGTVREHIAPLVKRGRFVYNPYLIAQGTVEYDMENPEMIMIGTENGEEDEVVEKLYELYDPMVKEGTRFEIGTWEEIEATKVFYNTFISAKLGLVNMIQDVSNLHRHILYHVD